MNITNVLSPLRVYLKNLLLLLFVPLVLSLSSGSLLKAQNATPAVEPPAPQSAPAQASGPLATTESEQNPDVRLEVRELKRTSGDTLTLKFVMINDSGEKVDFGYNFGDSSTGDFANIGGVHLIDADGRKKYFVVRDADGKCVCSSGLKGVEPGSRATLWSKFPAPPESVQKITVVVPKFIPMDDVPISK